MHDIQADFDLDYPTGRRSVRLIDRDPWDPQLTARLWSRVVYNPHMTKLEVRTMPAGPLHVGLTELICHKPLMVDELFCILSHWPNLEKVQVRIAHDDKGLINHPIDRRFTLNKMRHISVFKTPGTRASLVPILHCFTCPNIERLELIPDEGISPAFVEGLYSFIERSDGHLKTLKGVILLGMSATTMSQFFSLPQLQNLVELKVVWAIKEFYELLTPSHDMAPFLSALESLDIQYLQNKGWELSNMLLARSGTLKEINISSTQHLGWGPLSDRLWNHPNMTLTTLGNARPGVPEQVVSRSQMSENFESNYARLTVPKQDLQDDIEIEHLLGEMRLED